MPRRQPFSSLVSAVALALAGSPAHALPHGVDALFSGRTSTYKGRLLLGPTGARLWCDQLDAVPGLRGDWKYLHAWNQGIRDLATLTFDVDGRMEEAREVAWTWLPSHLVQEGLLGRVSFREEKWVSWDDVAVSTLSLRNGDGRPAEVWVGCGNEPLGGAARGAAIRAAVVLHGQKAFLELRMAGASARDGRLLERRLTIPARGRASVRVVAALSGSEAESRARAARWAADPDPLRTQRREYQAWFDRNCPAFTCDDARFVRAWWYRWFLVRHNLADPRTGNLKKPCFFEGRHTEWYPQVILFSVPLQLMEARWLRDPAYARGQVENQTANQADDGQFRGIAVDDHRGWYTHWTVRGAYEAWLPDGDRAWLARVRRALEREVEWESSAFDGDRDGLPLSPNHFATGMEWRPSFFFFTRWNPYREEPLETPDFASYHHANLSALAEAARICGDSAGALRWQEAAGRTAAAIVRVLWDPESRFFYGAREKDGRKALVKEAAGLFPFFAGAAPAGCRDAWRALFDPAELWTAHPAASCSRQAPVYDQQDFPRRHDRIEPHQFDCRWNGPTWPYNNSMLLDGLGRTLQGPEVPGAGADAAPAARAGPPLFRAPRPGAAPAAPGDAVSARRFHEFLEKYTMLHFEGGELSNPNLHEYYDGDTGRPIGVPDYFHSFYNDLLIRFVGGLVPSADPTVRLRPIPVAWDSFRFTGIRYHGRRLDILWRRHGKPGSPAGFRLSVDGQEVARRDDLGPLDYAPRRPR